MQGKSFFTQKQQSIYNNFNQNGGRKVAKKAYLSFYAENEPNIAQYFRVLYQIFRLISHSGLNEEDKVKYAKIARAQLSKDEVFFLYYNANTIYGSKFREYINEFNITKHLSILDKLEFKKYCRQLTDIENHLLHVAFFEIRKGLKECIKQNKEWYKTFLQGAVAVKCTKTNASKIKFIVIKTSKEVPDDIQQGLGFNEFNTEQFTALFYDFLIDTLLYSNFFIKNDKNLIITQNTTSVDAKTTITYNIENRGNKDIEII